MSSQWRDVTLNGLWKQNPGVVQILGMCPLLAISNNTVNAIGLGLATSVVMGLSNGAISALRNTIPYEVRIPVYVLIIAVLVTIVELLMHAYVHDLYMVLGIFVPLIVTNCIVLARTESFASKNPIGVSILDGTMMGLGLTGVLVVLGSIREVLGKGTLLSGIDLVFGDHAKAWVIHVMPDGYSFLLAILPPGAFIGLGSLIALKNWLQSRAEKRETHPTLPTLAQENA